MEGISGVHSALFELIFLIQIEMKKILKHADGDLSPVEILILRTLVEESEMSQQQLGERLSRDKAQITRLIQQLVRKQLVNKVRNPDDKRSFLVATNRAVKEKMLTFIEYEKQLVEVMLGGASEGDIRQLQTMLGVMRDNLKAKS